MTDCVSCDSDVSKCEMCSGQKEFDTASRQCVVGRMFIQCNHEFMLAGVASIC